MSIRVHGKKTRQDQGRVLGWKSWDFRQIFGSFSRIWIGSIVPIVPEGFHERGLRYGLSFCLIFKSGAYLDKNFELNAVFIFDMGFGLEIDFPHFWSFWTQKRVSRRGEFESAIHFSPWTVKWHAKLAIGDWRGTVAGVSEITEKR